MKKKLVTSKTVNQCYDKWMKQMPSEILSQACAWKVVHEFLCERGLQNFKMKYPSSGLEKAIAFLEHKFQSKKKL